MRYLHHITSTKGFIDLHNHTNSSFGEEMNRMGLTPTGLLDEAAEYANKFDAPVTFAISDHNNTAGDREVLEAIRQNPEKYKNINFIPGCEYTVSTASVGYVYDNEGNRKPVLDGKVHMLAYNMNLDDPNVRYLDLLMNTENKYMKRIKNTPVKNGSLVFATQKWLQDQKLNVGIDEFAKNCPITPDFDETEKGIRDFLTKKFGFDNTKLDSWHSFVNDGQNLVRYAKADVQEVMSIIQKAGGYTVLAHPGIYRPSKHMYNMNVNDPRNAKFLGMSFVEPTDDMDYKTRMENNEKMVNFYDYVFKSLSQDAYNPITGEKLDGIVGYELLHTSNQGNPKKFEQMIEAGDRYGLYVTAGSDSHGDYHPHAIFSRVVHQRTEQASVDDKNEKLIHYAVVGCKFVDDLKKSVENGTRLSRNPANRADEQLKLLKTDYNKEEYLSLGQLRQIAREAASQNGNDYQNGNNNHGNGGKKGGKKHGHKHHHLQLVDDEESLTM